MKLKVCVHLDPTGETLTTGAARQEHCGLDPATLVAVGRHLGRQVLIRRRPGRSPFSPSLRRAASRAPPTAPEP